MNKINKIVCALFAIVILYSTVSVYGYNLWYTGKYLDVGNGDLSVEIATMTDAYEGSTPTGGWINTSGDDYNISGGNAWFRSSYYIFWADNADGVDNVTSDYSGSDNGGTEIYYDVHSGAITPDEIYNIVNTTSPFSSFWGNHAWVKRTFYTGDYESQYPYYIKSDKSRIIHTWELITGGNKTACDVYKLTDQLIDELIQKFPGALQDSTKGIRFSSALNTTFNTYMDTAGAFYDATVPRGWSVNGQGMDGNGNYMVGKSVANEYDNWLTLPPQPNVKRQVYVNHVDEQGNVIPGFANNCVSMGSGSIMTSCEPKLGFQEHYTLNTGESINVAKSAFTTYNNDTYTFIKGKSATGVTVDEAKSRVAGSTIEWYTDTQNITTNPANIDDCIVINLVYRKNAEVIPPPVNTPLQLVGRLEFINSIDSEYEDSTSSHTLDYIPSTKRLTPYVEGAYPYVVRGIRYDRKTQTYSSSATVTITVDYEWQYWEYEHYDEEECTEDENGDETCEDVCTDDCGYYDYTDSDSKEKTFTYTVPFKHTWFDITNFKMYRISKVEVYDNNNNTGGTLFGGGTYTVNPSSSYESRFNNSSGKIDNIMNVSFPDESYSLPDIYKSASCPGSGESAASSAATRALNAVTAQAAADHENLTISYEYDNDYVELDDETDMLQRNYKEWSEHIRETSNPQRDLDSTRTGSGRTNGSALAYTSNLMSYMKPSDKLTDDSDFVPNYQTVPSNRENGLRTLKGKIYYNVTTDRKYNVGSDSFSSTDQTYRLNNPVGLTSAYFVEQTKTYKNDDVNDVNVLTPVAFGNFELVTQQKVDHTTGAGDSTILQKNAEFEIKPKTAGTSTANYDLDDTREFVKGYYFSFDFNVLYNGRQVPAGSPIYLAGANATLRAKTTDSYSSGSADQLTNTVKIVAVTTNITNALRQRFDTGVGRSNEYLDSLKNITRNSGSQNQYGLLTRSDIEDDAYHAIYKKITTKNVGRIFDFAVTDCTDLAFEDVFRKPNTANINQSTGVSYYSGYKRWNLYSTNYNEMLNRTDIGSSPQTILPLGPYKHNTGKYINAPKMGYRISFDLKTTGYMEANNDNNSRRVEITPSYYYISKDGKTFDNNIKLYYKNSSGKYVPFAGSGYTIYFKPNDGYRYLRNSVYTDDYSLMSTKLEALPITGTMRLTNKMMSANNTSFIQAWYGEYKLPNSTIAISNVPGSPNNNVNNSYKDGYIGVIFDIKCIDSAGFTLSYNTSDKSSGSNVNTSQWDYEGFMNFRTPGSVSQTINFQLEKDVWQIDNARYQQIKGTVVLYDLDNRAADDFE